MTVLECKICNAALLYFEEFVGDVVPKKLESEKLVTGVKGKSRSKSRSKSKTKINAKTCSYTGCQTKKVAGKRKVVKTGMRY